MEEIKICLIMIIIVAIKKSKLIFIQQINSNKTMVLILTPIK